MADHDSIDSQEGDDGPDDRSASPLPESVIETAERLTRRARQASDPDVSQRLHDERRRLLAHFGYRARVREDDRAVLVCYPTDWVVDGTVRPERVEDVDRGIERPLEGPGTVEDWEALAAANFELADRVETEYGEVHGANVRELAKFMNNHYSKPVETATRAELREFLEEYYPRNAWPSAEQRSCVETSIEYAFECVDRPCPY